MKNALLILVSAILFSCGGSSTSNPTPAVNTMTFKVNGVSKTYTGKPLSSVITQNGRITNIGIYGSLDLGTANSESLTMTVLALPNTPINSVVGTYQPITVYSNTKNSTNITGWNNCAGSSGKTITLTISAYNSATKTIQGTFSGTLCGQNTTDAVITDGQFNLTTQ